MLPFLLFLWSFFFFFSVNLWLESGAGAIFWFWGFTVNGDFLSAVVWGAGIPMALIEGSPHETGLGSFSSSPQTTEGYEGERNGEDHIYK